MKKEFDEGLSLNTPKMKSVLREIVQKIKKQPITQKMPGLLDLVPEVASLSKEEINELSFQLGKTQDWAWMKSDEAREQLENCLSNNSEDRKKTAVVQKKEEKLEDCSDKAFWVDSLVFNDLTRLYKKARPYEVGVESKVEPESNLIELEAIRTRRRIERAA